MDPIAPRHTHDDALPTDPVIPLPAPAPAPSPAPATAHASPPGPPRPDQVITELRQIFPKVLSTADLPAPPAQAPTLPFTHSDAQREATKRLASTWQAALKMQTSLLWAQLQGEGINVTVDEVSDFIQGRDVVRTVEVHRVTQYGRHTQQDIVDADLRVDGEDVTGERLAAMHRIHTDLEHQLSLVRSSVNEVQREREDAERQAQHWAVELQAATSELTLTQQRLGALAASNERLKTQAQAILRAQMHLVGAIQQLREDVKANTIANLALQAQFSESQSREESLAVQLDAQQAGYRRTLQELAALQDRLDDQTRKLEAQEQQVHEEYRDLLTRHEALLTAHEDTGRALQAAEQALRAARDEHEAARQRTQADLEDVQRALEGARQDAARAQDAWAGERQTLHGTLQAAQTERDETLAALTRERADHQTTRDQLTQARQDHQTAQDAHTAAQQQLQVTAADLATRTSELQAAQEQAAAEGARRAALHTKLEAEQAQHGRTRDALRTAEQAAEAARAETAEARTAHARLSATLDDTRAQLTAATDTSTRLTQDLQAAHTDIETARAERATADDALQTARHAQQALQEEHDQLHTQRDTLDRLYAELETKHARQREEADRATQQLQQQTSRADTLAATVEALEQQIASEQDHARLMSEKYLRAAEIAAEMIVTHRLTPEQRTLITNELLGTFTLLPDTLRDFEDLARNWEQQAEHAMQLASTGGERARVARNVAVLWQTAASALRRVTYRASQDQAHAGDTLGVHVDVKTVHAEPSSVRRLAPGVWLASFDLRERGPFSLVASRSVGGVIQAVIGAEDADFTHPGEHTRLTLTHHGEDGWVIPQTARPYEIRLLVMTNAALTGGTLEPTGRYHPLP